MEAEKRYVGGWWIWLLILTVLTVLVFGTLWYAGIIGTTAVERVAFESSFQYSEARKTEIAVFEAQLAEISRKLSNPQLDAGTRVNLEAAASGLRVQLAVARSKQK